MHIKWNMGGISRFTQRKVSAGLSAAANALSDEIKDAIDSPGTSHSRTGEFPHKDTGELYDGISSLYIHGEKEAMVVSRAPYTVPLENMRPFMVRVFTRPRTQARLLRKFVGRRG